MVQISSVILPVIVTIAGLAYSVAQQIRIPNNPCPRVFEYVLNNNGDFEGRITLPNNGAGYINLEVNVSISTYSENPSVQLYSVETDLSSCRPSIYNLRLPYRNNLPTVTRIFFNGDVLCSGPPEPLVPGGPKVWSLWRQSSYETNRRYNCPSVEQQAPPPTQPPPSNGGFQLIFGSPPSYEDLYKRAEDFRSSFSVGGLKNSLENNPFLQNRFVPTVVPQTPPPPTPSPRPIEPTSVRPSPSGNNQCGISRAKSHVTNLSFGGVDVPEGEFPWMAALMFRSDPTKISLACTVTLVSLKYVVTRGHCIDLNGGGELEKEDLLVVLGTRDISNWYVDSIVRNVSNIFIKNGIEPNKASNDVALIQMHKKVDYIPGKVVPICLWSGRKDVNENDLAKLIELGPGTVVGWGATNTGTTKLNKIRVPVIDHLTCIQSSSLPADLVGPNTFCGGYNDGQTGTCDTDAGASFGIQKQKGGSWYLRGILSITPSLSESECNLKGYSLYVDVAEHYQWMNNLIQRDGL